MRDEMLLRQDTLWLLVSTELLVLLVSAGCVVSQPRRDNGFFEIATSVQYVESAYRQADRNQWGECAGSCLRSLDTHITRCPSNLERYGHHKASFLKHSKRKRGYHLCSVEVVRLDLLLFVRSAHIIYHIIYISYQLTVSAHIISYRSTRTRIQ